MKNVFFETFLTECDSKRIFYGRMLCFFLNGQDIVTVCNWKFSGKMTKSTQFVRDFVTNRTHSHLHIQHFSLNDRQNSTDCKDEVLALLTTNYDYDLKQTHFIIEITSNAVKKWFSLISEMDPFLEDLMSDSSNDCGRDAIPSRPFIVYWPILLKS